MNYKQMKWDVRFMALATLIASWSKDPNTKVGCVIVNDHFTAVGLGYNGFARGVDDSDQRYADREVKNQMVVHAEANAILNAARDVRGFTAYTTRFPCPSCASLLIQSGISRIVSDVLDPNSKWFKGHLLSQQMFIEVGVKHDFVRQVQS